MYQRECELSWRQVLNAEYHMSVFAGIAEELFLLVARLRIGCIQPVDRIYRDGRPGKQRRECCGCLLNAVEIRSNCGNRDGFQVRGAAALDIQRNLTCGLHNRTFAQRPSLCLESCRRRQGLAPPKMKPGPDR